MENKINIGIIGGSGFYDLASGLKEIKINTPYGAPSGKVSVGRISGRKVAFLPRHNPDHDLPPHLINYRANIWALHSLGIKKIITATACGSLQSNIKPGDFVILDQFIDRTNARKDTFFDGPIVTHVSSAYPYCKSLNKLAFKEGKKLGLRTHPKGTVVVINGPRFSTVAESAWFTKMGWDVVNMTQYPEAILARELAMCYCAIALATDWDAGLVADKKVKPVDTTTILKYFDQNINKVKDLILGMVKNPELKPNCNCQQALKGAAIS